MTAIDHMCSYAPFQAETKARPAARSVPVPVQILSTLGYTGFAIAVSIVAMVNFGIIGVALAAFFAWQWRAAPGLGQSMAAQHDPAEVAEAAAPQTPVDLPSTGNVTFDNFRAETLWRLEEERVRFENFLDRLRVAKDQTEFDQFLNERAGDTSRDTACDS